MGMSDPDFILIFGINSDVIKYPTLQKSFGHDLCSLNLTGNKIIQC